MAEKSALELLESKVSEIEIQMSGYIMAYSNLSIMVSDLKNQYAMK